MAGSMARRMNDLNAAAPGKLVPVMQRGETSDAGQALQEMQSHILGRSGHHFNPFAGELDEWFIAGQIRDITGVGQQFKLWNQIAQLKQIADVVDVLVGDDHPFDV
ncbi:hypothetical protein D3C73_919610 [compost metagenome]